MESRKGKPVTITPWMRGYHTAKIEQLEFLSDVDIKDLSPALLFDWSELETKTNYVDNVYTELKEAYIEIGELRKTVIELRGLLEVANERAGQ